MLEGTFWNNLPIGFVHHESPIHKRHLWDSVSIIGVNVSFPKVLWFMHVRVSVNYFKAFYHCEFLALKEWAGIIKTKKAFKFTAGFPIESGRKFPSDPQNLRVSSSC